MDLGFATALQAYLEVGILGLIAIVFVLIAIILVKRLINSNKKKEDNQNNQYEKLLNIITEQNKQLLDAAVKSSKSQLDDAINKITNHTPSAEENEKQTMINNNIDETLQQILIATKADRVSVVQYHNGGRGLNKQSFLKMSMTNEQVQVGIKPFASYFKDQFRNVLAYFVKELQTNGKCYIQNPEQIKDIDTSMYEFLISRGVKSKYGIAIKNKDFVVIGFICVEYEKEEFKDIKKIDSVLSEHHHTIEALLNL